MAGSSSDPISYNMYVIDERCHHCTSVEREFHGLQCEFNSLEVAMGEQKAAAAVLAKTAAAKAVEQVFVAEKAATVAEGLKQKAAHSQSLCLARFVTFITTCLSLLSMASLFMCIYSGHKAEPWQEMAKTAFSSAVLVVSVLYLLTLLIIEGHCATAGAAAAWRLRGGCAAAALLLRECLAKATRPPMQPVTAVIRGETIDISVSTPADANQPADMV